jgi:chaperone required for assembly of F1-ATPase
MKRFWDVASVVREGSSFAVRLDGRPMRLPGGPVLTLESEALAAAIAVEWQEAGGGKGGTLRVEDVPLTRLAGTAQERVARDPKASIEALAKFAESDLLCYRAERPETLVARQAQLWQPWLDRAATMYGASFRVVQGVMPVTQKPESVAALRSAVAVHPPFVLAGLGILVPAMGSLVLGLAIAEGALDAREAFALAFLDELFQAEHWGEDREALAQRRSVEQDIILAARFIHLSNAGGIGGLGG